MSQNTSVSLFAGGGGKTMGAQAAGYTPVAAVELEPLIADCYRENVSEHMVVGDIGADDVLRSTIRMAGGGCELLLASPPCQNSSQARSKRLPRRADADVGLSILRYADALQPRHIIVENVPPYQHESVCHKLIVGLVKAGYAVSMRVLNFADLGVPQTRKRLIIQARKGAIAWPEHTAWCGWYDAIKDMLNDLPESPLAPWQQRMLPDQIDGAILVRGGNSQQEWGKGYRTASEQAPTLLASAKDAPLRAVLVHPTDQRTMPFRTDGQPSFTVMANSSSTTGRASGSMPRALLVGGRLSGHNVETRGVICRADHAPAYTMTASEHDGRIVDIDQCRTVRLTPAAAGVLQTFPRSYKYPPQNSLAQRIIGNALSPRAVEQILLAYDKTARWV